MNKRIFVILWALVGICIFTADARAGGLNRTANTGLTGVGNGSDPDGPWFYENLGSRIQMKEDLFEVGTEFVIPKITFEDNWGNKKVSKNKVYAMPYLEYGKRYDEDTVYGVNVLTRYGVGASFHKEYSFFDSDTVLTGTYVTPYVARKLTDKLTLGLGMPIVDAMLTWHGALDLNRTPLPINADTRALGFGVGGEISLFYQPTDRLALGIDYLSPVKCHLEGRTELLFPITMRKEVTVEQTFPSRLTLSAGWMATDKLLLTADFNETGYSHNSLRDTTVSFKDFLGLKKPVAMNLQDNKEFRLGASYKFNEKWTAGLGVSHMDRAFSEFTTDMMTPDATGKAIAGRIKYSPNEDFSLTAGLSCGWGKDQCREGTMAAEVWTVALSGCWKF